MLEPALLEAIEMSYDQNRTPQILGHREVLVARTSTTRKTAIIRTFVSHEELTLQA